MRRLLIAALALGILTSRSDAVETPYFRFGTDASAFRAGLGNPAAGENGAPEVPSNLLVTSPWDGSSRASGVSKPTAFMATAAGATGTVAWSQLPPGGQGDPWPSWASVSPEGNVSLTPPAVGRTTLRLYATDAGTGATTSASFTVDASTSFTVHVDDKLFRAAGQVQWTDAPTVANAVGTVTWTVSGLPDWMAGGFEPSSGRMHGTIPAGPRPDETVTLTATDGRGQVATAAFKVKVGTPLVIDYADLNPNSPGSFVMFGSVGKPMSHVPTLTGAVGRLAWKQGDAKFALPDGLVLDQATGGFSGTPAKPAYVSGYTDPAWANYFFNLVATDVDGSTINCGFSNAVGVPLAAATLDGSPVDLAALTDGDPATGFVIPAGKVFEVRASAPGNAFFYATKSSAIVYYSASTDGTSWQTSGGNSIFNQDFPIYRPSPFSVVYRYFRIKSDSNFRISDISVVRY